MKRLQMTALLAVTAASALTLSGCGAQCAQIKNDYAGALKAEEGFKELSPVAQGLPTHVGVGVKLDLIGQVAEYLIGQSLKEALGYNGTLPAGVGQQLKIGVNGDAVDLGFQKDAACEMCFNLAAKLGGDMTVDVPFLGRQRVPLNGDMKVVAPLVFEPQADGRIKMILDLTKVGEFAGTTLSVEVSKNLPDAIARAIRQPLAKELTSRLTGQLKPMHLGTFDTPEFGIAGVKFVPSSLAFEPSKQAIFVGFATNLPGAPAGQGLNPSMALEFGEGENFAVALQPALIMHAVSAAIQDGTVPRTYDLQGKAAKDGPAHVTMNAVEVAGKDAMTTSTPVGVNFRTWTMGAGPCFWFDALVSGVVALEQSKLSVDLSAIKVTDASIAPQLIQGITNWKTAEFVKQTKRVMETTLAEPKFAIPGGALQLAASSLGSDATTLTLRSKVNLSFK
jgi:hypothetical protein